jgi:hypothetical protein
VVQVATGVKVGATVQVATGVKVAAGVQVIGICVGVSVAATREAGVGEAGTAHADSSVRRMIAIVA